MKNIARITNKLINVSISIFIKLIIYALLILLIFRASFLAYNFGYSLFSKKAAYENGKMLEFEIKKGDSIESIAKRLKDLGLIDNEFYFIIQANLFSYNILEGKYELDTSFDNRKILEKLSTKKSKKDR